MLGLDMLDVEGQDVLSPDLHASPLPPVLSKLFLKVGDLVEKAVSPAGLELSYID